MRNDGRSYNEIRPVTFSLDFIEYPEGSVLINQGKTRVLCNVSVEESIPRWMELQGIQGGWITAEYAMLPRATHTRTKRESNGLSGRTQEIRRLIGRSMRMAVDLKQLGDRTLLIDCDVLQADGGTRTASITGSYVALALAIQKLKESEVIKSNELLRPVAAISVGIIDNQPCVDLSYEEDHKAEVDLNVVMTGDGDFIEIQGTAERQPFSKTQFDELLKLAENGIGQLIEIQKTTLNKYINLQGIK